MKRIQVNHFMVRIRGFISAALDLLFPRRCVICDEILPFSPGKTPPDTCPSCRKRLPWIRQPLCMKCGNRLTDSRRVFCSSCTNRKPPYDRGISVFQYNGDLHRSVSRMKSGQRELYLETYAYWMYQTVRPYLPLWKPDCLIPVPMHRKKIQARGYNQAEILARKISQYSKIPVNPRLVKKIRPTSDQKTLSRAARRKNLHGAFRLYGDVSTIHTVLLIDDIYTTGSTVSEITTLLKQAGIREVYILTLAIGYGTDAP